MEPPVTLILILAAITFAGQVHSQTIYATKNPISEGSNVTLVSNFSVTAGGWIFNNQHVVLTLARIVKIAQAWIDRVTYDTNTSSLTIRSLKLEDSGVYTLEEIDGFLSMLTLSVEVPVSNVTAQAKATNLVEFNDTAVLMCSVSKGTPLSFAWLNGSSVITANGRAQLSNGNTTLTIVNVARYDHGPYSCQVSNDVSNETSTPVNLTISYGPTNTKMTIMPLINIYKGGSNITLSCSAESSPPPVIQWMFNGEYLHQTGSDLQLQEAYAGYSGSYTCLLHNTVTSRFTSATAAIQIVDPVTAVVVSNSSAILGETFSLLCHVTGTADIINWWRNGHLISADNKTTFSADNKTLTLNSVLQSDGGHYQCQAFNSVSNMTSDSYAVTVNYGPETPIIYGPTFAQTGHQAVFNCSAISVPPSQFYWWFNGSIVANTSVYTTDLLSPNMSGEYTCMAINDVTGKNNTNYVMFTVIDPIKNVIVNAPMTPANEGSSYSLTCSVTGPADHVYWMTNGARLHEDNRTVFYMPTVSFDPVERYDTGNYQCMAINAVGNMTSPPYKLIVNYGPETPIIYGPAFAEKGGRALFTCSAVSVPPSQFYWWFNGSVVANTSEYTTNLLSFNMSGEYTCMAMNHVTGKNSTNSTTLTVIEAIESVKIKNNTIPINNAIFDLTCEVIGPYDTIFWMKDNVVLGMNASSNNSHMSYNIENKMLHFTPVTIYSDGAYQCVATNKAGHHVSPEYRLLVNYGPLSLTISRANVFVLVTLTCMADSRPDCDYYWFFNNLTTPLRKGPAIVFPMTKVNEGNYICTAWNPVTNITMTQNMTVTAHASTIHFPYQGSLMMVVLFALSTPMVFN